MSFLSITMDAFVSLHGMCHNLHKVQTKECFTSVPNGIRAYVFTPTNCCVYSNDKSEEMMMDLLRKPHWTASPEINEGGMFSHAQLYDSGATMCNLLLEGDSEPHFGVYELCDPPKKLPMVFDTTKTETTYDISRLLHTLKSKHYRNVYFCICSPHTISPYTNSVLKWDGKHQPKRKATIKYESFAMTAEISSIAFAVQEQRLLLEKEGKQRFKSHIPKQERRFTRSMSFPLHRRNGSTDHEPLQIGLGLGDAPIQDKHKGIYFQVDLQDQETNRMYLKRFKDKIEERNKNKLTPNYGGSIH